MDRRTLGVVFATFLGQGLAIGGTVGAFSLFVRPLTEAFDASNLQVSVGISLITLTLAMCGVPVGNWLDRGSPRKVMFTGCAIISTAVLLASQATSLGMLALLCVMTGVGIPMLGPLTTAAVVGKTAEAGRGRALGIANLGVPVGGMLFSLLAGFTLDAWDWRTTLQCFGAAFLAIGLPAVWFGIPADLASKSTAVDESDASRSATEAPAQDDEEWTPKRLIASIEFRLIALVMGVGFGTTAGFAAHIAPYLVDLGATTRLAGTLVGAMQGLMLLGTLGLGALADRRPAAQILIGILAVQLVAFGVMSAGFGLVPGASMLMLSGIASGGLLPVLGQLLAQRFGAASLGRSMGLGNLMMLPFGFGLPMVGGALRDATGSYASLFMVCMGLFAIGLTALIALQRRPRAAVR
ncbi:MAG: MFS transporter [Myxococcota bacterium]|nr:MFS transporter [Myxococcota bacterium]